MAELRVNTDRLTAAAPSFADAAADISAAQTRLRSALAGLTEMCGDDEQGRTFAEGYNSAARKIDESLSFASISVTEASHAVKAMAENYDEMDEANARASRTTGGGG